MPPPKKKNKKKLKQRKSLVFLTLAETSRRTGYSKSRIYQMSRDPSNSFPARVQLSPQRSAFLEHEVDAWIAALAEERTVNAA